MISMQKHVITIWVVFLSLLVIIDGKSFSKPLNCGTYECPSYKVNGSENNNFEIRKYKNAVWVSSPEISSTSFIEAANRGFLILYNYTQGNNNKSAKFNLTAPVLIDIINPPNKTTTNTSSSSSSYIVYFYIPRKYQKHPPYPLSTEVQLQHLPRRQYAAVRRFGGFINDTNISTQVLALKESLKGSFWEFAAYNTHEPYSVAAYNAPFEIVNRVNEVFIWFDI